MASQSEKKSPVPTLKRRERDSNDLVDDTTQLKRQRYHETSISSPITKETKSARDMEEADTTLSTVPISPHATITQRRQLILRIPRLGDDAQEVLHKLLELERVALAGGSMAKATYRLCSAFHTRPATTRDSRKSDGPYRTNGLG
ncbi:hypothetical protein ACMFMG_008044 [Clarireedia jacksonii]